VGKDDNSILKNTGIMTIATMLSRVTGLLRMWAMAFALGNTLITSAYQVANNVPNAIFDLVAGGLLGTAFLPIYLLQKEKQGRAGSDRFASNILNLTLIVLGVITILATVFAGPVIATQTFTQSVDAEVRETAVFFFRIFAVQVLFYGLGGVVAGVLNANRVYGLPALSPMFNSVCVIVSMFAYVPISAVNPQLALVVIAVGTTLGVLVQFAVQIPALMKIDFKWQPVVDLRDPALKEAMRIAIPTFIYIAGVLIAFSCRNAFSLQTGDTGASTLFYAWMWYQLPYGVVAVSISTAFLTEMSDAVSRNDFEELRGHVQQGLRSTLFLIIPMAGLMAAMSAPIIQLFRSGAFQQDDVVFVSSILVVWVLSLPFYAGQMYFYRVFAALRQFMTFALVSCGLVVVQIGLYWLLCSIDLVGLYGVPAADFVYFGLMFATMAIILRKRVGAFGFPSILLMCAKVTVATALAAVGILILFYFMPYQPSILDGLLRITLGGIVGIAIIFAVCKLLKVSEMEIVSGIIKKLFARFKRH